MNKTDILTDHGIIVLDENERGEILTLLEESIDKRFEKGDDCLYCIQLYNKLAIGRRADSTIESEFGVYKQKKDEKNAQRRKKPKPKRKKND